MTQEGFYGTEEGSVSQGDILDTSLHLSLTSRHPLSGAGTSTHAIQSTASERERIHERFCKGGLHAPQSDLYFAPPSPSTPPPFLSVSLSLSLTLISLALAHVGQGTS